LALFDLSGEAERLQLFARPDARVIMLDGMPEVAELVRERHTFLCTPLNRTTIECF
jgi:hypothetical protein